MRKKKVNLFFAVLTVGLLLTCVFGVRAIGKDLYKYYKKISERTVLQNVNEFFGTVDNTLNNNFAFRAQCIDVYGWIQRIKGNTVVEDPDPEKTVVKGSDGKLYFAGNVTGTERNGKENIDKTVNAIKEFSAFCKAEAVDFLYVLAPSKYSANIEVPAYINVNDDSAYAEYFTQKLSAAEVDNINFFNEIETKYDKLSDAFFVTDHHWSISTAFWAYQVICNKLNASFDANINDLYINSENYSIETFFDCYLGSMGVRVGKYYAGKDDIDLIQPKYETDFDVEYSTKTLGTDVFRSGNFRDAIISGNPDYAMYITSDNALIHVDNKKVTDEHKVLLVKDSFGVPVAAWLSCWADELWVMDLRYEQEESVEDFIVENGIDTVIVLYNANMMSSSSMHDFENVSGGR